MDYAVIYYSGGKRVHTEYWVSPPVPEDLPYLIESKEKAINRKIDHVRIRGNREVLSYTKEKGAIESDNSIKELSLSGYEWDLLEYRGYVCGLSQAGWYYLFLSAGEVTNLAILRKFYDPPKELLIKGSYSDDTFQPKLLLTNQKFLELVSSNIDTLYGLSPREFEVLTAEILVELGYSDVRLGPGSKDDGVDVMAVLSHEFGRERILVQCKKYSSGNKVGLSTIKQLLWDVESKKATRGLIVTTSTLTKPAQFLVESYAHKVTAIDFRKISELIRRMGLPRPIADKSTEG